MHFRKLVNALLRPLKVKLEKISKDSPAIDWWTDDVSRYTAAAPLVVFDVGANNGQAAAKMHRAWPKAKIYSFEPNPVCVARYQAKFEGVANLQVFPYGVGAAAGELTLKVLKHSPSSSFLDATAATRSNIGIPSGGDVETEVVAKIVTLDAFAKEQGVERIDFLKCDTQGFDLEVLKGAAGLLQRKAISGLIVESNFAELYKGQSFFDDIVKYLGGFGYVISGFYDIGRDKNGVLISCDTLFFPKKG